MLTRFGIGVLVTCGISVSLAAAQNVSYVDDDAPLGGNGQSWTTAYRYLQDALYAADGGQISEIRVAGGTHRPDHDEGGHVAMGSEHETFTLRNGVAIRGGYAGLADPEHPDVRDLEMHESVLSGDINMPGEPKDNSNHVTCAAGTNETAVLDGFTVRDGTARKEWWQSSAGNDDAKYAEPGGARGEYGEGGGMLIDDGSPALVDCTFVNNWAEHWGGGAHVDGGQPTLTRCTFAGNHTVYEGAGLYCFDGSPTLIECSFTSNWTEDENYGEGAGMCILNAYTAGAPTLTACEFVGNAAHLRGGGLAIIGYFAEPFSPTLTDCTFRDNSAAEGGGLSAFGRADPILIACTFSDNCAQDGGGMSVSYESPMVPSATVIDCTFNGNVADERGGALLATGRFVTITGCTFFDNAAEYGGGIWGLRRSFLTLMDCAFLANSAVSGGGVYGADVTVIRCLFSGNLADSGGGMQSVGEDPSLTSCTFTGNVADVGGGLHAITSHDGAKLANCTFLGNQATTGAAIHGYETTLTNCTLFGNMATSTAGGIDGGDLTLANCVLWANTAPCDAQIHGTAAVTHSCVQGGYDGEGNTPANPLLGADLHLRPGSPCIDAADNTAVPADEDDLDNDGDVDEPLPSDLHGLPRFADDPDAPDSGVGSPPIVDMGAYELQAGAAIGSADLDGDGDVDMDDFTLFQQQFTGPQ